MNGVVVGGGRRLDNRAGRIVTCHVHHTWTSMPPHTTHTRSHLHSAGSSARAHCRARGAARRIGLIARTALAALAAGRSSAQLRHTSVSWAATAAAWQVWPCVIFLCIVLRPPGTA